jgi:hypothetical protein
MRNSDTPERKYRKKINRENTGQNDMTPELIAQREIADSDMSVGPEMPIGKFLTTI